MTIKQRLSAALALRGTSVKVQGEGLSLYQTFNLSPQMFQRSRRDRRGENVPANPEHQFLLQKRKEGKPNCRFPASVMDCCTVEVVQHK